MAIPTIATRRLTLRGFTLDDVEPLHAILADPDALRYFPTPGPPAVEKVEKLITRQLEHWDEHGFGWWAVEPAGSSELIGWNGLQYLPETDETEVGYLLAKDHWGRGLATEGAVASLRFGFETLGLACVIALVHPENAASMNVIRKLGMPFTRKASYFGIRVNHYSISRQAYQKRSPRIPRVEPR